MTLNDNEIFGELEARLKSLLPEEYQDAYDEVEPVSMGSAGVRYGPGGMIAWDQMWGSFCDLAMAGGPPHKGTLLEPAAPGEIDADPAGYRSVVAEICRGIGMVTDLEAAPSPAPGWVRMECATRGMASWLVRAIAMENVAVRADGQMLELPAGPAYRLHKEIKNVITAIAKTTHYWVGHMPVIQRQAIATLLEGMDEESPLVQPCYEQDPEAAGRRERLAARVADAVQRGCGLSRSDRRSASWLGFECGSVRAAVWMMRMLVTVNVLSRREERVLFVPLDPELDASGEIVSDSLLLVHRMGVARGVLAAG